MAPWTPPHLLLHDAHLERRLGVLHRLADAHLGVVLGRLVHLRQRPLFLSLQTLLAGVLHALGLAGQAGHLLLGAGDDAQGLLHDGGPQLDRLLLVGQVVSAGRFPEEGDGLGGLGRLQPRGGGCRFQLLLGVFTSNQGAQEGPLCTADPGDRGRLISSLAPTFLIGVTDVVKAQGLLQARQVVLQGIISQFSCIQIKTR